MKSMTGYGRGESVHNGLKLTVELSSVNRKQSEIMVILPRELEPLEPQVRDEVNRKIARGRLTARVALQTGAESGATHVRVNADLARAYLKEVSRLGRELGLSGTVSLDLLANVPGIIQVDEAVGDASECWPALAKALRQALEGLVTMRLREGAHLGKDLRDRLIVLRRAVDKIRRQAPLVTKYYRKQLQNRLREAGLPRSLNEDQRLLQEVVLFTDRSDITEELTRLTSHFQQVDEALKSREPVGRTLDFLAQEMYREVNTIGSKANDSRISREVVTLKAELERIREQVQNIE